VRLGVVRRGVLALLCLVVAAGALVPVTHVSAHASLISSTPDQNEQLKRPPSRIILHFSEAIERKLTTIEVTNKAGERVDTKDVAFDDQDATFVSVGLKDLPPDLYFVKWANVSKVDGHNVAGSYPFIVLQADGSLPAGVSLSSVGSGTVSGGQLLPSNVDSALKWLALLSLATVLGAAFMLLAGIRPAAAFLEDDDYETITTSAERAVAYLAHVLLPLSFITSSFLILRTVSRFDTSTGLVEYLTTLHTGQYQLADLILILVALAAGGPLLLGGPRVVRRGGLVMLIVASAAALFTYSMISHGAANPGKFWGTSSDYLHLLSSATWLGALVMLVPLMRAARRLAEPQRFLILANVFDRFSIIAGISVAVILATGTINGITEIPNAPAMVDTTYGKVLLAKIALILPLLAVAGLNALILKPRLVTAIDGAYQEQGGTQDQRERWKRSVAWLQRVLPWTVAAEVALILAVFAAVGVLTQTSTAKGQVAQKLAAKAASTAFKQTVDANDLKLTLEVTPNQVGLNQFDVTIDNQDGSPSTTVTFARLRFTYDQVQNLIPESETTLTKSSGGDWRGQASNLSQPGNWRVQIDIRRSNADDVSKQVVVAVARTVGNAPNQAAGGAFALPFSTYGWNEVGGALLALAGAMIIIYRKQLRWLEQPGYRIGIAFATLLMLGGAVLVFGVHSHTAALDPRNGNPVAPTQASVAAGRAIYEQNCAQCHGVDGHGDGPAAAQLNPAPADFRLHIPYHDDPQFYNFIANGYPQSAMPKFGSAFKPEDIWNLVNFLRASFTPGATQ
jgi:copper transport protein